ncbi:hypothetical protein [Halapricum sp. CBA1109]|uniref:hypothetical protein n=1 Tax=Halapricum sp. CBA1109 TaxID=2668068 RepID=UPI0018D21B6F|nr:hypothetical protein [Halapricum sp. CBA1109]
MQQETDVREGNQPVAVHLESALQTDDSAQKNYHVRQAMQLLIATEDATAVGD